MTNYVSFSLYGESRFYHVGAIENVKLCSTIYPDWTPIVYVDQEVPEQVLEELRQQGAIVVQGTTSISLNKRTWRFSAALISDAEKVIFRDADSRINIREKACVEKWLESGKTLHIMRDHPDHANWIMAGMWGIDAESGGRLVSTILSTILSTAKGTFVGEDQHLLAQELYFVLQNQSLVHDSFFRREKWAEGFPTLRENGQFVGERIDEGGRPEKAMREVVNRYENSALLRFRLRAEDYRRIKTEQKLGQNFSLIGTILNYLRASSWRF
jgi:hypothetical protein